MALVNTFVAELNQLTGQTVEIAYVHTLLEAIIVSARGTILVVVPTGGYYSPTTGTMSIAIDAIDFVRIL